MSLPRPGTLITETDALQQLCEKLRRDKIAALDTEFVWNRTYLPRLGIVQLGSAEGEAWLLDGIAKKLDPAPLAALLSDADTVKILHDAHQDLALLKRFTGSAPLNVFDTRLAAGFAGYSSTLSLKSLLSSALNVELAKTETLTDWCLRPLSPAQLEYALGDVNHLPQLRVTLLEAARQRGAENWLAEDLAELDQPEAYDPIPPRDMWRRVKGAYHLNPAALANLRELAAMREEIARDKDRPRNWVISDEALTAVAAKAPRTPAELQEIPSLRKNERRLSANFLEALAAARDAPPEQHPQLDHLVVTSALKRRATAAIEFLKERAEALRIAPELFGSRAQITAFLATPSDQSLPMARGWRFELAGRLLIEQTDKQQTLF